MIDSEERYFKSTHFQRNRTLCLTRFEDDVVRGGALLFRPEEEPAGHGNYDRDAQEVQAPEEQSSAGHAEHDDRRQREDLRTDDQSLEDRRSIPHLQVLEERFHILRK